MTVRIWPSTTRGYYRRNHRVGYRSGQPANGAGLPVLIAGAMFEVLGEADVYFDPEHPAQIAQALQKLLEDHRRRQECAQGAYERAQQYSWERCAKETFSFLSHIVQNYCE